MPSQYRKRRRDPTPATVPAAAAAVLLFSILAGGGDSFATTSHHAAAGGATTAAAGSLLKGAHDLSSRTTTIGGVSKDESFAWGWGIVTARRSSPRACGARSAAVQVGSSAATTIMMGAGKAGKASGKTKPPSLPQGEFRPKQSLGQNYLSDQNYVMKICNHFGDTSEGGRRVLELGPGAGALTQVLHERFPDMLAVDIDQRAIELLGSSMPSLNAVMSDVLQLDYTKLAKLRGGPLSVIGNLPYHITSQILFTLCDHYQSVRRAVVTMQLEVAQRIVAKPSTKQYGILSVVFQLYARPQVLFQIPPTVFYPQPSVTSALISLDFTGKGPGVNQACLKSVLSSAFQQRRKMLRQSLKPLLRAGQTLPEEFATRRPEQLEPLEFVALTRAVFGDSAELPQGTKAWRGMRGSGLGAVHLC
eukprot:g11335.t1